MLPKKSGKDTTHQSYSDLTDSICTRLCVYLALCNFIPCICSCIYYHKDSSVPFYMHIHLSPPSFLILVNY